MSDPKEMPDLVPTESSNIQAVGYQPDDQALYVRFTVRNRPGAEGPIYRYDNVPPGIFSRFSRSASKGGYFWTHIRSQFRYHVWTGLAWRSGGKDARH